MPLPSEKEGCANRAAIDLLVASRRYGRRVDRVGAGRPAGLLVYRRICSPAVAEIVGDGRPWTVLMISELSMPCR